MQKYCVLTNHFIPINLKTGFNEGKQTKTRVNLMIKVPVQHENQKKKKNSELKKNWIET